MKDQVRELLDRYIGALDNRRFDDWLGLFTEDGYYGVILHEDMERDTNLVTLGETLPKLRARIEAGEEVDRDLRLHFLGALDVRETGDGIEARAGFFTLRGGAPSFAGRYRLDLVRAGGELKIKRCMAVLDHDLVTEPIYLPI